MALLSSMDDDPEETAAQAKEDAPLKRTVSSALLRMRARAAGAAAAAAQTEGAAPSTPPRGETSGLPRLDLTPLGESHEERLMRRLQAKLQKTGALWLAKTGRLSQLAMSPALRNGLVSTPTSSATTKARLTILKPKLRYTEKTRGGKSILTHTIDVMAWFRGQANAVSAVLQGSPRR